MHERLADNGPAQLRDAQRRSWPWRPPPCRPVERQGTRPYQRHAATLHVVQAEAVTNVTKRPFARLVCRENQDGRCVYNRKCTRV